MPAGRWTEGNPGASLLSGCPGDHASPLCLIELAFAGDPAVNSARFPTSPSDGQFTRTDDRAR